MYMFDTPHAKDHTSAEMLTSLNIFALKNQHFIVRSSQEAAKLLTFITSKHETSIML